MARVIKNRITHAQYFTLATSLIEWSDEQGYIDMNAVETADKIEREHGFTVNTQTLAKAAKEHGILLKSANMPAQAKIDILERLATLEKRVARIAADLGIEEGA